MKVKQVNFNWFFTPENGEEFSTVSCGQFATSLGVAGNKCISIEQHTPAGEGDRFYYDAIFADGQRIRIFNPNQVFYFQPNPLSAWQE